MEIIRSSNPAKEAGERLSNILGSKHRQPILLMLSGGSAFAVLEAVDTQVLGPNITLSVLDERYSTDPAVNNFSQLTQTPFFKSCVDKGVNFISTKVVEGESKEQLCERWNQSLQDWKNSHLDGLVIATMGIGVDGHTAGIFPNIKGVDFDSEEWVVAYSVPKEINEHTERITVTNTFLKTQLDEAVVYVVGDHKKAVVSKLISSKCDTNNIPACLLKEIKKANIFTGE